MTHALLLILLAGPALAQEETTEPPEPEPSDLAVTSLGTSVVAVPTLGAADLDLLLGQRLRWGIGKVADGYNRVWLDSRFTIDPLRDVTLERTRVTRAGVELRRGKLTTDLGRSPVRYGGPRLVDGIQALVRAGDIQVGGWAGLAPDLFTTIPRLRPGFGPTVAWEKPRAQASLVGEVALSPDFQLDRLASLAMVRGTVDRWLDLSARADVDWVSVDGPPRIADARALAIWRPTDSWRFDATYNAFSSLRYLQTEPLDPLIRRFQGRILANGIDLGIQQDFFDPTLNHLVGAGVRWADPPGLGAAFRAQLDGRYRYHPNPLNRFARVHTQLGVGEIPVGGALDLAVDGSLIEVNGGMQLDPGLIVVWEPTEDRSWALDSSGRLLLAPDAYEGFGWYADLFADAVITRTWMVASGVSASREPDPDFDDLGVSAFVRLSAFVR